MNINSRVCYIEIETQDYLKQIENIDFSFNIKKNLGSIQSEATIGIYNLAKQDINYLNSLNPFSNEYTNTHKIIRVFAGYEKTGYGLIFQGDIWSALPTGKPDTLLNIKAKSNYYNDLSIITINYSQSSLKAIAKNIADILQLSLIHKATRNKTISSFNYSGSKTKLIEKYNELDDYIIMYCNDKDLIVRDANEKSNSAIQIDYTSGLIGEPVVNTFGVKIKTLLNPIIKCGDWIYLKSALMPMINGYFQIFSLEMQGQSRGNDFYNILDCKRPME